MSLESHVQVRLMSASSLRAVNVVKGASDPYAVVTLARTAETQTTVVCLNTVDPKWYHNLVFRARPDDILHIRIYDRNLVADDRDLGSVSVAIGDALSTAKAYLSEAAYRPAQIAQQPHVGYNNSHTNSYQDPNDPPPPQHRPHQHPPPLPPRPPLVHHLHGQHHQPQPIYPQPQQHHHPHLPHLHLPHKHHNPPTYTAEQAAASEPFAPSAPPITPPPGETPHVAPFHAAAAPQPASSAAQRPPSLYPYVPAPPPHAPSATNPLPPPPPSSQPAPPPSHSHTHLRSSGDLERASGSFHSGASRADVAMQRLMTRTYPISPRGCVRLVIAPGSIDDLARSAPRNHYKRFQTHKFTEQVGNIGKLPFQNKVGQSVGAILKKGANMAGPLQSALDLFQPVHAAFQEHSTWKVDMRDVDAVFRGKRHEWNRDYPAAQKIFQGKGSVVARTVVQMQHAYLYGGASGIKPLVTIRKDLLEVTGNLIDAKDLFDLMEYGIRRGKPRMFTYVLMPERLYVAETGAKFFRDMMSKHAMHCSASQEVVYAGELHFRRSGVGSEEPEIQLVLDNNSGTYTPGKEDLPLVEEVFRRNFAGLDVVALDYKDPRLEKYRKELPEASSENGAFGGQRM